MSSYTGLKATKQCLFCSDSDGCKVDQSTGMHLCRVHQSGGHCSDGLKKGDTYKGSDGETYAFKGLTTDCGTQWAQFALDKPLQRSSRQAAPLASAKSILLSTATSKGSGNGSGKAVVVDLAKLPEEVAAQLASSPHACLQDGHKDCSFTYDGDKQWTQREYDRDASGNVVLGPDGKPKKRVRPYITLPSGEVCSAAGDDPWPLYRLDEAVEYGKGRYVLEGEGEKVVEAARRLGLVCVTQPGHGVQVEQCAERYKALKDAGVVGVAYVSDNDTTGDKKADRALRAATQAGLSFVHVCAVELHPDMPAGGSIDDLIALTPPAQAIAAIESVIAQASQCANQLRVIDTKGPATLEDLLGPLPKAGLWKPGLDQAIRAVQIATGHPQYNLLTNRIEVDGKDVDPQDCSVLYLTLAGSHQLDTNKEKCRDAFFAASRLRSYHPVRDYFDKLYENETRLSDEDWSRIAFLSFGTEDPLAQIHLQRQLIAMVARAAEPGCKLDTCLIIQGEQGIGKSTFWKVLGGEWFCDSLGSLSNHKDDLLILHSAWIHEWGEVDRVVGKRESETVKRFLSQSIDTVRLPYTASNVVVKRSAGIIGTTNRYDFIKDPTGNRRYPIFRIEQVNTDWVIANRDAIWGAALHAYKQGLGWFYSLEETKAVSVNALKYTQEDPLKDSVETYLQDHPEIRKTTAQLIMQAVGAWPQDDNACREAGRKAANILQSLGWQRIDKRERFTLPGGVTTVQMFPWVKLDAGTNS